MPKEEESIEDRLIKELDGATEPHAAWEAAKPELQKGTAAVAAKPKYQSKVKGPELTDKVEGYATDFYAAMGQEGSGDKKMLAHRFRTMLGDNYGTLRQALKIGDTDTAGKLTRDAYENEVGAAQLNAIIERMTSLPSDVRVTSGKKLVAKVGGKEYAEAVARPDILANVLSKQKSLAEHYK